MSNPAVTSASLNVAITPEHLLLAVDLMGTLVFAVEGAMAAVDGNLDLIGIMTLAFATALGGGIVRDVLLGTLPPAALRDWRYPTIVLTTAILVFFLHQFVREIPASTIQILDAAGLAIFAIAGTQKALLYKMNPLVAVLLGTITGVGGGTIRDVLLNQVPKVLQFEIYASAAMVGSACMGRLARYASRPVGPRDLAPLCASRCGWLVCGSIGTCPARLACNHTRDHKRLVRCRAADVVFSHRPLTNAVPWV
ncbi:MAG: TRIC cation channel family protein [Candidatus Acidiferrum sp.]